MIVWFRHALLGITFLGSVAVNASQPAAQPAAVSGVPADAGSASDSTPAVPGDSLPMADDSIAVSGDSLPMPRDSLGLHGVAASHHGLAWTDLLREHERLVFDAGQARLPLVHPFLQFGSEVVRASDSLLVRNRDYGVDYGRGVVFLLSRPAAQVELEIEYLYLPGPRKRSFRAAEIETREAALEKGANPDPSASRPVGDGTSDASGAGSGAAGLGPGAVPSTLQLSGSNNIGVSFGGNREATLDQSLRVEVSGELGEDLRVNAVLADDNLPVTAEGSTEELGDLSKVFIEMQGPVVGGVIGDYTLGRTQGDLVDFRRDLRGGELRLDVGGQQLAVGAGLAKGDFETATFRGVEGKQGPYELLSARRIEFSTIVPGSERVYLDGAILRRGENQDYVVDYDRGELRFTSRRRITADSEIAVDFQVNGAGYRRQTSDARLDGTFGSMKVHGLVFSESDDRDAPYTGAFTPEDLTALEGAGDRPVIAPGIEVVGVGRGLYRADPVDSTIVRYAPITGDLDVHFYEAGAGMGAYEDSLDAFSGRRVFVYRGSGRGAFAIGRQLVPATQHRLASAQVEAAPWSGTRVAGEFSVSGYDANVFSPLDDTDNVGEAVDLRLDMGQKALAGQGGAGAQLHVSQLSSRFHAPGRARVPFYYKEWNAESDSLKGTERIGEATLAYGFGGEKPWLRVGANGGRLDRGNDLVTDRAQADVALGRDPQRGFDLHAQVLDTARPVLGSDAGRTRNFLRTGGRYRLGRLVPEVRVERDAFVRADVDSFARPSYRYLDVVGRLALLESARTTATLELGRRNTDEQRSAAERAAGLGEWQASRRNDTYGIGIRTRPTPAWNAEVDLSRRTFVPLGDTGGVSSRSDLARSLLAWTPRERAARAEWRYQLSDETVRTLQQVLVLSPDGKGDYDAEGRPVGKDLGMYDKVVRYAGDVEPVRQVETSLRLELGGFAGWNASLSDSGGSWVRRNISLVQTLSLKEQSRGQDITRFALLFPSAFQNSNTVFGSFRARQEWSFLNGRTVDALRLFLELQNDLDGRLVDNPVHDRQRTATLRYERTGLRRWTWGAETGGGLRARTGRLDVAVVGRPSSGTFDVQSVRALVRAGYRLSASERLGVDFETQRQVDDVSSTQQLLFTVSPSATLAPTRSLRLLASVAATRVIEDKLEAVLAPYFFDPPGTKATISLLGSYRLGRSLQFNVTYNGIRGTDGRFNYDAKAETRAIF
jgi:hypothetical protein